MTEHIHEYVWHPDSTKIIYMTGKKVGRGYGFDVESDGIWLFDIVNKTKKKIAEKGWGLRIDINDNNLYYWDGDKTIKQNVDTGEQKNTNIKKDVEYSPDYRYYIHTVGEDFEAPYWSPFRIYDTKENKNLSPEKIGFVSERNPTYYIWSGNSRAIIFSGRTTRLNVKRVTYIYDIETYQVVKSFDGAIAGYDDKRSLLVVYRDGEFIIERIQ